MNISNASSTPVRIDETEWYTVEDFGNGTFTIHFTREGASILSAWGEDCNPLNHPDILAIVGLTNVLNEGLWYARCATSHQVHNSDVNSNYEEHGRRGIFDPDDEIPF